MVSPVQAPFAISAGTVSRGRAERAAVADANAEVASDVRFDVDRPAPQLLVEQPATAMSKIGGQ